MQGYTYYKYYLKINFFLFSEIKFNYTKYFKKI